MEEKSKIVNLGFLFEQNLWLDFEMNKIMRHICILIVCITTGASAQDISIDSISSQDVNLDSISQHYIDLGYLDCEVSKSRVGVQIDEGIRYLLEKIVILPSDTVLIDKKMFFVNDEVNRILRNLIESKVSEGYLYQSYTPKEILKNDGKVTVVLAGNQGPRPRLSKIRFEGLRLTDDNQLQKYISIDSSAFITKDHLNTIEADISAVPYINYEPPLMIQLSPGYSEAELILATQEKRLFSLEGSVGYLSDRQEFLWMGDLTLQNLFGKGKRIDIYSRKVNADNQNLSIQYWQPSFLLGVGGLDFTVATRDYRNRFYEFSGRASALFKVRSSLKIGLDLTYKSVEQEDIVSAFSVYGASFIADYSNKTGTQVKDNQYRLLWRLSYSTRRNRDTDSLQVSEVSFNDTRIEVASYLKIPLISRSSLFYKINYSGYETRDELPPFSELYLVGGEGTIRGFRDEQFSAIRTVINTVEHHIGFNTGYFFSFIDAAYIYNRNVENGIVTNDEIYRIGYGFGILFDNRVRQIQISFGWNKDLPVDQPRLSVRFQTGL